MAYVRITKDLLERLQPISRQLVIFQRDNTSRLIADNKSRETENVTSVSNETLSLLVTSEARTEYVRSNRDTFD